VAEADEPARGPRPGWPRPGWPRLGWPRLDGRTAPRAARPDRRTALRLGSVLVLAGVVFAFVAALAARHGFFDLRVYYGALNYWADGRGSIYDYLLPGSTYGFTYPPFAALAMLPMAVTPWQMAIVISVTAAVVTTVILLYWLVDPVARRQGWTRW